MIFFFSPKAFKANFSLSPWGRAVNITSDFSITSSGSSQIKLVLWKSILYMEAISSPLKDEDEIASTVTKGWFKSSLKSSMPTYPVAPIIPTLDILAPPFFHL